MQIWAGIFFLAGLIAFALTFFEVLSGQPFFYSSLGAGFEFHGWAIGLAITIVCLASATLQNRLARKALGTKRRKSPPTES